MKLPNRNASNPQAIGPDVLNFNWREFNSQLPKATTNVVIRAVAATMAPTKGHGEGR